MAQQHATHMTEGVIWKQIVKFALPVFLGNLFQQLYNVTDSLIVGNFIDDKGALGAVTTSGSLIFLLVGLFQGIFIGAGVVIARYWGAKEEAKVHRAVHTTIFFAAIAGIILTVVGVLFTPTILGWMDTPKDVLPHSITYFRIYFSGAIFSVLYNASNGVFQAVGDSRHPLYYLIVSSVINVVLDLLFVAVFGWKVAGAAFATIIAQAISAFLSLHKLTRSVGAFRLIPTQIRPDMPLLKEILRLGIPSGVQNAIISFANIIVQFSINGFEVDATTGCGVYSKIEGFAFLPITAFSMALTTFIGQNLGAREYARARKGARFGVLTCALMAEIIGLLIYLLIPHLIGFFNNDPMVVHFGTIHAQVTTLFYFLLAYSHAMAGVLRGAGKSIIPMIVMMICWCLIRVTYVLVMVPIVHELTTVSWAYPLTWTLSSICFTVYYFKADWVHAYDRKATKA